MNRRFLILGTGNLAWHLAHGLQQYEVTIWGRNTDRAQAIARSANIHYSESVFDDIHTTVFYAVNDDAVRPLSESLAFTQATEVHLSGALPIRALCSDKRLVMWPVRSLVAQEHQDLLHVHWVTQGAYAQHLPPLQFTQVDDDITRQRYHLAAVILNNFVHHMGVLTKDFVKDAPLHLFRDLLAQTTERMMRTDAGDLQTGPARRGDQESIRKHLSMLENQPDLKDVYHLFTALIAKHYE